jgi:predicted RNA binding protein YcfA (HicA-like mRNA interferase family)
MRYRVLHDTFARHAVPPSCEERAHDLDSGVRESQIWRRLSPSLKVGDDFKLIEEDGRYSMAIKGNCRQFKHPPKTARVTLAGHPGDDRAQGALNRVLKQADVKWPKRREDNM